MRKILTSSIVCILSFMMLVSCKKVQKLTQFDMDYSSQVTIPSSTGINLPFSIGTPDIATNSEAEFAVNDTRKDLIEKITLKSMKLTVSSPSTGNFDFLKSAEIYIKAEGLDPVLIASKYNIQDGQGNVLNMDVTGSDFKEYIKKDKFSLEVKSVTDKIITQDYTLNVDAVFFVDAKILGL